MFTEVFGYFKEEILDWKLEKLLPDIYAAYHADFMSRWLEESN